MRVRPISFLALCLLAGPLAAAGLTPRLVKDINPGFASTGSVPSDFFTVAGVTFFTADDGDTGGELWRTDGTAAGTYRLADICPGDCSSYPAFFDFNDHSYFFLANDGDRFALWVSSGTPATTFKLAAVGTSDTLPQDRQWVPGLGLLFFAGDDFVHGFELWRSDGTPGGTYQVADLMPGPQGSNPRQMTVFNNRLYFVADDPQRGPILWRSDGTARGTQAVSDPVPGSADHVAPTSLWVAGKYLYFVAPTPAHGVELWKSDGTSRGTAPLTSLVPGTESIYGDVDVATLGNRLLFPADDGKTGQQLWATDGTPQGTKRLTHFTPPQALHPPGSYFAYNRIGNRLIFSANDGVHGTELWTTDGTAAGTVQADLVPGSALEVERMASDGTRLLITGHTSDTDEGLWLTDGTAAGTRRLGAFQLDAPNVSGNPVTFGGALYFVAGRADLPPDPILWKSDGTAEGTVPVLDSSGFNLAALNFLQVFAGRLVFTTPSGDLWQSDGTPAGTGLIRHLAGPGEEGVGGWPLTAAGSRLFFRSDDHDTGEELWALDPP